MICYGLIPAAGRSRNPLGVELDNPAALNRILGKPIITGIVENLISVGIQEIFIGIEEFFRESFELALAHVRKKANIILVSVDRQSEPLLTIKLLFEHIKIPGSVLINLGDTLLTLNKIFFDLDFAVYTSTDYLDKSWSRVLVNSARKIAAFVEKGVESNESSLETLCGVYWFRNFENLSRIIRSISSSGPISNLLQENSDEILCIQSFDWIDSDHIEIFEKGKIKLLESRTFNQITLDNVKGEVIKRSDNKSKLRSEILYYEAIPITLKRYFPKMLDYRTDGKPMQVLEYIPWPTLSEIMNYQPLDHKSWEKIFVKLNDVIFNDFEGTYDYGFQSVSDEFYFKVLKRNNELRLDNRFDSKLIDNNTVFVNGITLKTLSALNDTLLHFLEAFKSKCTFIHGDFCGTNILINLDGNIHFKFIDPRGGFIESTNIGPQVYDVAKLAHSAIGYYDAILADRFTLNGNKGNYILDFGDGGQRQVIEDSFLNCFVADKFSLREVKIFTGLIMLGIPTFHLERRERALAMYLRGLQLLNEGLEE